MMSPLRRPHEIQGKQSKVQPRVAQSYAHSQYIKGIRRADRIDLRHCTSPPVISDISLPLKELLFSLPGLDVAPTLIPAKLGAYIRMQARQY